MKKLLLAAALVVGLAAVATAQTTVLWDQSDYDQVDVGGLWDSDSGCFPFGLTFHAASDIRIFDEVTITKITTWYSYFNFDTGSAFQAYLYIAPKTGSIPVDGVDLPQENGTLVPVSAVANEYAFWVISAEGLSISLSPGDYWVCLTPTLPGGFFGPDTHVRALSTWGDPTAQYEYCGENPSTWFPNEANYDASLLIEGTVDVVPTAETTWGDMKALFR